MNDSREVLIQCRLDFFSFFHKKNYSRLSRITLIMLASSYHKMSCELMKLHAWLGIKGLDWPIISLKQE